MRLAILQTMYDEHENVLNNILEVSNKYKDSIFFVTHSFERESKLLEEIKQVSYYRALPNLAGTIKQLKLPANAISRNYADLFKRMYVLNKEVDMIVVLTGDTKITNAKVFENRHREMKRNGYKIYTCQAKNQVFWSKDMVLDRVQTERIADFMPQLFFVDGNFAFESKVFKNIKVVNEYTSEQCLGDELLNHASMNDIGRLNGDPVNWLSYTEGVIWQCLTNGEPGRL